MEDRGKISKEKKVRLDRLLADRGIAESREKAQALIVAGQVIVDERKIEKAGTLVFEGAIVRVLGEQMPYVSRGGLKLARALSLYGINVDRKVCIDIGASTGGFTDCLLQHGAAKVYAVDVGYGQLAWKLRQDPRVMVVERTNIREMSPSVISDRVDIAVIDVSFISLEKVIPAVDPLLGPGAVLVALIKPQFEVGRGTVGKGGIVRDESAREAAKDRVTAFVAEQGYEIRGVTPSPITGQDGNVEYLLVAVKTA